MKKMRFFIDTHDKNNGTFPSEITTEQFKDFYKSYEEVCREEGVISLKIHAGLEDGRAFCLNMASDVESVFRVHERMGLPYDNITEVSSISPEDILFKN